MAAAKSRTDRPAKLTIALVGGGSGGHITPLLAVAEELKKQQPDVKLVYIGQTGDRLLDVPQKHHTVSKTYSIRAGKFRRYHGEGLKQLLDIKTFLKNVRDFFYFLMGTWQAYWLLGRVKPDIIFVKGGFVGVPVGLAAAKRHIPFITHDSDAIPGLANLIIARWATEHAVALPKSVYKKYPASKTHTVGVPVDNSYRRVTDDLKASYQKELGIEKGSKVIFITGGGNGALRLNEAVLTAVAPLLKADPKLFVIHGTGREHEAVFKQYYKDTFTKDELKRTLVKGFFVNDLYKHSGAADIVITRAGATNLAEFAMQQKCCIIVPNPQLTGGHQTKNANYLSDQKAAVVLYDDAVTAQPDVLGKVITDLLANPAERAKLSQNLGKFAQPRAAKELAQLLLETVA